LQSHENLIKKCQAKESSENTAEVTEADILDLRV